MDLSWLMPVLLALTIGGIWVAAKNAEKAANEAEQIKRMLMALTGNDFGGTNDFRRIANAVETLVRFEQDKREPLSPPYYEG